MAATKGLNPFVERRTGSTPVLRTNERNLKKAYNNAITLTL